jgi:hypothetical protein
VELSFKSEILLSTSSKLSGTPSVRVVNPSEDVFCYIPGVRVVEYLSCWHPFRTTRPLGYQRSPPIPSRFPSLIRYTIVPVQGRQGILHSDTSLSSSDPRREGSFGLCQRPPLSGSLLGSRFARTVLYIVSYRNIAILYPLHRSHF